MDRNSKISDYASAYKLKASASVSEKKTQRVQRRSIEQRDLRQNLISKRRNIDLSPLQEGECSIRDKNYKDKTPSKPKVLELDDKKEAGWRRLEQLKKWKAERELKKKQDLENQKKVPFRYRKVEHKDQAVFKKQAASKPAVKHTHPVPHTAIQAHTKNPPSKPVAPVKKEINNHKKNNEKTTKPVPAKSYEKPTQGSMARSTSETRKGQVGVGRLTRSQTKEGQGKTKEKKEATQPINSHAARSSRNSKHVPSVPGKTAGVTKQSVRSKVTPDPEADLPVSSDMAKVSTSRGGRFDSTESFAPDDYTFNAASFVFKPLSPNSAAGFLYPGDNSSCSFLDHNPKVSSTPKGGKRKARTINNEDDDVAESTIVESPKMKKRKKPSVEDNHDEKKNASPSDKNTPKNSASKKEADDQLSSTLMDETVQACAKVEEKDLTKSVKETVVVEKDKTPVRRSSRRSVLSSTVVNTKTDDRVENHEDKMNVPITRSEPRKSRRSTQSSLLPVDKSEVSNSEKDEEIKSNSSAEQNLDQKELSAKKQRRSTRKSVIKSTEKENIPETVHEDNEENCVFVSEKETASSNTGEALSTETMEDSDKSRQIEAVNADLQNDTKGKKKTGRRGSKTRNKSFGGFLLPESNCVALSASAKRTRRKTVMPRSPEEWVDLLSKSPMVEMTRRKPKLGNTSMSSIDFDDVDLDNSLIAAKTEDETVTDTDPVSSEMPTDPKLNLMQALQDSETASASQKENGDEHVEIDRKDETMIVNNTNESTVTEKKEEKQLNDSEQSESTNSAENVGVHDVQYFRRLLVTETARLRGLCNHWEEINKAEQLSEEVSGQIRTTVGQAVLLMNQRFNQFTGLVDNCEFKTGEKETTCTDLDGFWDMIYFQVEDVDAKFEQLKKLQANNWIDDQPKPVVKKIKKKVSKPAANKPAVKSKFAAFRAQMKKKQEVVQSPGVVTAIEEEKVFEMPGFFRVASPVRSPAFHCEAGTPKKAPLTEPVAKTEPVKTESTLSPPTSAELLMKRTPGRKSYAPAVPSPLLVDSTPQPRPTRSCTKKTPVPRQLLGKEERIDSEDVESKTIVKRTPRRSIRARKSVNFSESAPSPSVDSASVLGDRVTIATQPTATPVDESEDLANVSEEKFVDDDVFAQFLQPMSALYGNSGKENSPSPAKRGRTSNGLKSCPSSKRRKSQSKKVQFNSPSRDGSPAMKLPGTPFYKEPTERRVTRQSLSGSVENQDIFSLATDENSLQRKTRSPRPSLLYTPPDLPNRPVRPLAEVPTATLISFTP